MKDVDKSIREGLVGGHMTKSLRTDAASSGAMRWADASWRLREQSIKISGVEISVVEGREMPKMDGGLFGLCDPYIKVRCRDEEKQTKHVQRTLSPTWNETFYFQIEDEDEDVLIVECWDYDLLTEHDFIGSVEIKPKDLGDRTSQWYILTHPEEPEFKAEVFLKLLTMRGDVLQKLSVWDKGLPEGMNKVIC